MDDLNGREDTPKTGHTPIGITHISPNEQRWIGPPAEHLQACSAKGSRNARPSRPVDRPFPCMPPPKRARCGRFRCAMPGGQAKKERPAGRPFIDRGYVAQAKLASAKSQLASEAR